MAREIPFKYIIKESFKMKNVPIAKENGKGRLPIILTVAAVICLAVVFGMILRARITEKHYTITPADMQEIIDERNKKI